MRRTKKEEKYTMKKQKKQDVTLFSPGLMNATGEIPENLTNDVILHSVTQNNNEVLKGLTAALLMLPMEAVSSVELLNPIDYRNYADKEIILDIKAKVNNERIMNVELQMLLSTDSKWWINRSLLYLCRTYDNLKKGGKYDNIYPSMQVSIVPEDVFSETEPEFYSSYHLKNDKNGHIYTRDFSLRVLYLNHIDLATEEDKRYGLDYWADAFRARTWEELKTLAARGEVFKEMAEAVYTVNADVSQRSIAEAHRKWVELNTYLTESRAEAEQKAAEAEQKAAEAEQKAAEAEQQAAKAEQQADEAEQKLVKAEAELARYREKYGDEI